MTKKNQNFELWQGETMVITVPITDSDGNPKSLSGATVVWKATSGSYSLEKAGSIVSVNSVQITLTPADTIDLPVRAYRHECRVIDVDSNQNVVFEGDMVLHESSTKPD